MRRWMLVAVTAVLCVLATWHAMAMLTRGLAVTDTAPVKDFAHFRDCAHCPEMVVLPRGSFEMGATHGRSDERPAHRVTFTRRFAIGVKEVTVGEWRACVAGGGCDAAVLRLCSAAHPTPDDPVCGVGWRDAEAFIAWLRWKTGQPYRLPSEAEWEYAARGGSRTRYWWGELFVAGLANCAACDGRSDWPTVAGRFPANAFGLLDVAGNLDEWTRDCWHRNYRGAPANGRAWLTGNCRRRVVRGGSRASDADELGSAYRQAVPVSSRRTTVRGFRVARDM